MSRSTLIRSAAAVAVAAGFLFGGAEREARASAPGASTAGVYLWKDLTGRCPSLCDRNLYECPCVSAPL